MWMKIRLGGDGWSLVVCICVCGFVGVELRFSVFVCSITCVTCVCVRTLICVSACVFSIRECVRACVYACVAATHSCCSDKNLICMRA